MNQILEIREVSKIFKRPSSEIRALQGVTFSAGTGEFISIIGKSGSGKSTLLSLIGGLDTVTGGSILADRRDLAHMNRTERAMHRRKTVGMIFQSFNLIPSRNAADNVTLALAFGGMPRKNRRERAEELLTRVGLGERLDHKPAELSGGEAQRVAVARALANGPRILLADEPTGNLDSVTSAEIIRLLFDLNKKEGKTVLMVTHDQETAEAVSDRIIRLKDGMIAEEIYPEPKTDSPRSFVN